MSGGGSAIADHCVPVCLQGKRWFVKRGRRQHIVSEVERFTRVGSRGRGSAVQLAHGVQPIRRQRRLARPTDLQPISQRWRSALAARERWDARTGRTSLIGADWSACTASSSGSWARWALTAVLLREGQALCKLPRARCVCSPLSQRGCNSTPRYIRRC